MLFLQLNDGEYLTIGKDIVIQVFTKAAIRVSVNAPKDMTILRGEVLERNGEARPSCLYDEWASKGKKPRRPQQTGESPSSQDSVSNG